jgi:hypothetical protein
MLFAAFMICGLLGGFAEINAILCAVSLFVVYAYFGFGVLGLVEGARNPKAVRVANIFVKLFLFYLGIAVMFYFAVLALDHPGF